MGGVALSGELADQTAGHGDGENHADSGGAASARTVARAG